MSTAMNQLQQINPELAQKVASYIKETDALITELKTERDSLRQKTAALEKNASGTPLDAAAVVTAVDHVIQAGFMKQADRDKAIKAITTQPALALLSFVDKLASQRISVRDTGMPKLGRAVETPVVPGSAPVRESDRVFEQRFDNFRAG